MSLTPPLFVSTFPDLADVSKLRPSDWNRTVDLLNAVFDDDAIADGAILLRNAANELAGVDWLEPGPAGYVLTSAGEDAPPVWAAAGSSATPEFTRIGIGAPAASPFAILAEMTEPIQWLRSTSAGGRSSAGVVNQFGGNLVLTQYGPNQGGQEYAGVSLDGISILETSGTNFMISYDLGAVVFVNGNAETMRLTHAGLLGIGTPTPTSKLHVIGLAVHANNAAALAGGLTAGAFYRTGADPDPVCVVH
jgi:hypothetical protein